MINKAAEALVELLNIEDLERRATFPDDYPIREVKKFWNLIVILKYKFKRYVLRFVGAGQE